MIKFKRKCYSHYGVYVGNGDVIHLTTSCCMPEVKIEPIENVANGSPYTVDNNRENKYEAHDPNEISYTAHKYIGFSFYRLLTFNCETFASMCRYGKGNSRQAAAVCGPIKSASEGKYSELRRKQRQNNGELEPFDEDEEYSHSSGNLDPAKDDEDDEYSHSSGNLDPAKDDEDEEYSHSSGNLDPAKESKKKQQKMELVFRGPSFYSTMFCD